MIKALEAIAVYWGLMTVVSTLAMVFLFGFALLLIEAGALDYILRKREVCKRWWRKVTRRRVK